MAFFTEFFVRPRPKQDGRYAQAINLLGSMSSRDMADIGIKPADFPRIARQMAGKP